MIRVALWACALALVSALPASAQAPETLFLGGELSLATIEAELDRRVPRSFRPVGTSSVTLRVDLGGGMAAAFKPRTRAHPRGFAAEIVAYRIARALEMDNVPPVILRSLPRPLLENRVELDDPSDWEAMRRQILWAAPGLARGATIYWIPSMQRTELDTTRGFVNASQRLAAGTPSDPEEDRTLRDLSTMIAFDYLIGNWDRFSGGNVSTDESGRLFVRDHNVAFQVPLVDRRYRRLRSALERVQRFSRGFLRRVEALDQDTLEELASMGEGNPSLLLPAQVDGVLVRRRALLSYVGGLIAQHGVDAVLCWE